MKKLRLPASIILFVLCVLFSIVSGSCAQKNTQKDTNPAAAEIVRKPAIDEFSQYKDVRKEILDNGLTVIVKEINSAPLVAIQVRVKTGSAQEGEYLGAGISHFIEHMIFKGTQKRPAGMVEKQIKSYGGHMNAFTTFDQTGFYMVVGKEYFGRALELLADILSNPSFDPIEFSKEKDVILKEIRLNNDDPDSKLFRLLFETMYLAHPYRHPIIGYESIFKELTADDLLRFFKKRYVPNNMVISIVGDVDKKEAADSIRDIFGKLPQQSLPIEQPPIEPPQVSARYSTESFPTSHAHLAMGFHSTSIFDKDLYALDILAVILGHGDSSRLNEILYRDKRLVYFLNTWNFTPKDPGCFVISFMLDPANVDKTIDATFEQIENIKTSGVSQEELQKAKNQVLFMYIDSMETVEAQAGRLAADEIILGDFSFSEKYIDRLSSVTINDIREAAKIYLTRENLTIVKLMPNAPKETKTEEESLPKNGLISKKAVLANGLRVIAIEDKKLPLTSIGAVCLGGVRFEDKEKNGISNLTANVLIKGTSSLDESKISGLIESLGGSLSAFSGNNSFGVTLRLLSKDLDTGLGLLHDIINNPSFDAKILDREKNLVLAEIKSQDEDIFQKGMNKFKKTLFKDLPYGLRPLGEEAPLNKLTREDLLSFYKSCKDTQNMTLAVVGDIDPDAVIKKCESLFSDIAPDGHRKPDLPNMIASEGPREYRDSIDKEQSIVIIGFPGAQIDNKDRYALDVISSILSGSDGRLFSNLRSKLGISYAQGAISVPGLEPGYFATYIATTKDNIDTAKNGMIEEIGRIKNEYVSDEELESVKRALINIKRSNLQSISDIMLEVSLDELYGLGYDNYSIYEENINGITTEDIKTAANKYFDMNNLTTAIIEGTK